MKIMMILFSLFLIVVAKSNHNFFIAQDMGQLHLSQRRWEFRYNLDLHDYFETANILEECIQKLMKYVILPKTGYCDIFKSKSDNFLTNIRNDIANTEFLRRDTRELITLTIILVGTSIMLLIATGFTKNKI